MMSRWQRRKGRARACLCSVVGAPVKDTCSSGLLFQKQGFLYVLLGSLRDRDPVARGC
jgi:hypothetical protein